MCAAARKTSPIERPTLVVHSAESDEIVFPCACVYRVFPSFEERIICPAHGQMQFEPNVGLVRFHG